MYTILRTILIIKLQVFKPSKISTKILKGVNLSHWEVEKFSFSHIIVTFVGKKSQKRGRQQSVNLYDANLLEKAGKPKLL